MGGKRARGNSKTFGVATKMILREERIFTFFLGGGRNAMEDHQVSNKPLPNNPRWKKRHKAKITLNSEENCQN